MRGLLLEHFREVARRFAKAFGRALPHLDEEEVQLRTHFLVGAMAHTLLWSNKMPGPPFGRGRSVPAEEALDSLVRFAVAGMAAPMAPRSEEAKR
jgi:hypothetical protein